MSPRRLLVLWLARLSLVVVAAFLPVAAQAQGPCPNTPVRAPGPNAGRGAGDLTTCDTVVITPSAGTLPDEPAFTEGFSAAFWVKNGGPQSDTFTFQCVNNYSYTICRGLPYPQYYWLAAGDSTQVTVYYATDHPVTQGSIQLYANGQTYGGAAQGYYTFNITAPDYAVTVMPSSKTSVQRWAFSGPYSDVFKVRNIGALVDTFNLSCTAWTGTTCAPTSPTKVTLQSGDSATVNVNYSVGWPGTGTLTFTATSVFGSGPHGPPVAHGDLTVPIYVSAPSVSTAPYNFDDQDLSRCASGCFAAAASEQTVPYVTLGTARSVGLVYQGDRIVARPFIAVDVQHPTGKPSHPKQFWLQVKVDGAFIPFLNGDTTMHFGYDSTWVRLAGQIDAKSYATGVHPLQIIVTSQYDSAGVTAVTVINTSLVAVNEAASPVARGWTVAGVERLYQQADSSAIVTTGDGSYVYFHHGCDRWGCSSPTATPAGEFSRLVRGTGWTRLFADSTKVVFDNTGRMTQILDRFGNVANVVYDANGRIWKIQDPTYTTGNNHQAVLAYAAGYGLSTITDPMGRVTRVTVNADSTLRVIKFFGGDSVRFAYTTDGTKRLQAVTDARGYIGSFYYNTFSGKIDSVALPAISINGGATQAPVTRYSPWQTKGEPTTSTAVTPFTPVRSDSVKATVTDPEGHATSYTVDHWGQPILSMDAVGRKVTVAHDSNGLALSITNPWGGVGGISYNADGLVTGYTPAGQAATNITIGAYGQPQEISGTNQADQYLFLGLNGRVDSIRYAGQDSIKSRFTYNARGQVLTAKDAKGHTSSYHYDATFGNLDSVAVPGPNGPSTIRYMRTKYDKFGRDSAVSATGEPWSRVVYDSMNQPLRLYDGVYATPTTFSYDHGILSRVVDAKGQVYKDSVNALGWPTRQYSVADTTKYASVRYNRDGMIIGVTNRRGHALTYTFDTVHRLLSSSGQNAVPDSFTYKDSAGGPITVAWDLVARESTFANTALALTKGVTTLAGRRFARAYYHNSIGALDSVVITTDTGTHIHFANRTIHRNAFTQDVDYLMVGNTQIDFFVDAAGRRFTTKLWNTSPQISKKYIFTSMGMLDSIGIDKANLNTAFGRGYGYDSTARIAREFNAGCNTWRQFSYDGRGRLTTTTFVHGTRFFSWGALDLEWGGSCTGIPAVDSTKSFTYDSLDNRTDNGAVYLTGNRLASMSGFSFTYDDDGNELTKSGNGQNATYYWSADEMLDSVKAGSTTIRYQYDAVGRLVRKDRNGQPQRYFLWDGGQLLAELDSTGGKRVGEYAYDAGIDNPIALITGDTAVAKTRYFMQNNLGSVVGIVRDTFVDQQLTYDSWGAQQQVTGTLADTNRLRWQGLFWEGDSTRLYYVRARWYDPQIGRFVSEDPEGLTPGGSQYAFGDGDPINEGDPTGLDPCGKPTNPPVVAVEAGTSTCPDTLTPDPMSYEDPWNWEAMDPTGDINAPSWFGTGWSSSVTGGGAITTILCKQSVAGNTITTGLGVSGDAAALLNALAGQGLPHAVGKFSSFRTLKDQVRMHRLAVMYKTFGVDKGVHVAAYPGRSNHEGFQGSQALDINDMPALDTKAYAKAIAIAARFHFYPLVGGELKDDRQHLEHRGAAVTLPARACR